MPRLLWLLPLIPFMPTRCSPRSTYFCLLCFPWSHLSSCLACLILFLLPFLRRLLASGLSASHCCWRLLPIVGTFGSMYCRRRQPRRLRCVCMDGCGYRRFTVAGKQRNEPPTSRSEGRDEGEWCACAEGWRSSCLGCCLLCSEAHCTEAAAASSAGPFSLLHVSARRHWCVAASYHSLFCR